MSSDYKPIETRVLPKPKYGEGAGSVIHQNETLGQESSLAASIIERWALVAAIPDGEDAAGRQKLRLPTSQELVTRALDISSEFFEQSRARGLLVKIPLPLAEVCAEDKATG